MAYGLALALTKSVPAYSRMTDVTKDVVSATRKGTHIGHTP